MSLMEGAREGVRLCVVHVLLALHASVQQQHQVVTAARVCLSCAAVCSNTGTAACLCCRCVAAAERLVMMVGDEQPQERWAGCMFERRAGFPAPTARTPCKRDNRGFCGRTPAGFAEATCLQYRTHCESKLLQRTGLAHFGVWCVSETLRSCCTSGVCFVVGATWLCCCCTLANRRLLPLSCRRIWTASR